MVSCFCFGKKGVSIIVTSNIEFSATNNLLVLLPGSKVKTINLQTGEGDVNESFFLDLKTDLGTNWDRLVECQLDTEGDGLAGGNHNGEGFNRGRVQTAWLSRSIWKKRSQIYFVKRGSSYSPQNPYSS